MKHGFWTAATLATTAALGLTRPAAAADALALKRVVLSTGGVGYFELEAKVHGDAELPLEVRLDQVDDVLKSVVVYDDRGAIGEITLPGKEPLRDLFHELPFDQSAFESEVALLNALRGAEVRVSGPRGIVMGRIVAVVPAARQPTSSAAVTTIHYLTLMSDGALKQVVLEEAEGVEFVDERLRQQVQEALVGLARQSERGRRGLTVRTAGEGDRVVRVAYVVEVPLWKPTYRLTLSDELGTRTAALAAWAVVENQSGKDWQDVDFTLVAGNPVTFRQALYDVYYVKRPEIPVDVAERVLPKLDEGATIVAARAARLARYHAAAVEGAAPAGSAPPAGVEGEEAPTQVVFHFPAPVSLGSGQSALLPLAFRDIPAERLWLYQPETSAHSPLASVKLKNEGDTSLPPGAVTLYERSRRGVITYLGDARLGHLPAGEERLVSFAIDRKVRVDREERSDETFARARITGSVLELTRTARKTTRFAVTGAAREPRVVLLEHPRLSGWDLVQPREGVEVTEDRYRLRVNVPAGETVRLDVALEQPLSQRIELTTASSEQIAVYVASRELPQALREALARASELLTAVTSKQTALASLEAELADLRAEQGRVRENLKVVPAGSALYERYLTTLGEQEDRIKALGAAIASARGAVAEAREAVSAYVRGLDLDARI